MNAATVRIADLDVGDIHSGRVCPALPGIQIWSPSVFAPDAANATRESRVAGITVRCVSAIAW
jgi:hypothetical protein